ncbi:carboxylesterase 5A isoform X6 [Cavia porcellus]|uniref:carboxylesterase 5A isoform X6 n=1 Tax=Cavia porcellus TaxID=10141 RepID=UPI000661C4BC
MSMEWVRTGQALIWAIWILVAVTMEPVTEVPQRNTRLGWVQGKQVTVLGSSTSVNIFLGIPFAMPPLGHLRFANPEPAMPWNDLRQATSYPTLCFQNLEWMLVNQRILKVHYPKLEVSEDCLYLNIYAPAHADVGSNLPVMVWFPGGGFENGSASIFDGSALAAYENVLVVTIQYRLGIFGFFNTGDRHAPGNWAFMDQLAALSWVQENIKGFGGNPGSVTIFGESAGAISVSSLILSPLAKNLFHKAIMESGVAITPNIKKLDETRTDLQMIADVCGCNASDSKALLNCLRTKSSSELLNLGQKTKSFDRVVDGIFSPDEPLELLSQKAFKAVPSIIGVNNHECGFMLPLQEIPDILSGSNRSLALHVIRSLLHLPVQYLHVVANEYFPGKHSPIEIRDSLLDLLGDVFFVVPALVTAQYHREGATKEEKLLSRRMMKYWANFARSGNPNGNDLPLWPAYNHTEKYLMLNLNMSLGQKLKEERVKFWTNIVPLIMSASEAFLKPLSPLIFFSLPLTFFFSFAP